MSQTTWNRIKHLLVARPAVAIAVVMIGEQQVNGRS